MKTSRSTPCRTNSRQPPKPGASNGLGKLWELRKELLKTRRHDHEQTEKLRKLDERFSAEATEHHEAEAKLKKCDQLLKDVQRITRLGNWEWDIAANRVEWSDELYRIYGLRPGQFKATFEAYLERVHPKDRARAKATIEGALQEKKSFSSEERIIRADGAVRFLSTHGEVITDKHNHVVRMLGCCQDITERKVVEQKLAESLSLHHATLESTADGILVVDLEGRLVSYNHKFAEMWQLPPVLMGSYEDTQALELALKQLKNPGAFLAKVRHLYEHPEVESFDILEFKDGRVFERLSQPQRIEEKIVGRVWSFRDETAHYRALEALRKSEEKVRWERDFMDTIINGLPGIFYVLDDTGKILRWNKNAERVLGYKAEDLARMYSLDIIADEDKMAAAECSSQVLLNGYSESELNLVSNTGERFPYLCSGTRVELEGKPCIVGMGVDISKLKQAKEEIRKLTRGLGQRVRERTAQLKAINKELESFSYSVSHDLRAPLRAIAGFALMLREDHGTNLNEEALILIDRILQAGDRMSHLIEDLLNYSRIGRSAVTLRPVPIKDLIKHVASDFTQRLKIVGGTLSISEDLPVVSGDATLLGQAFANLFDNAINYRKRDVPLELSVSSRNNGEPVICVSDNGIGIAPVYHDKIFEVFQRLHKSQEYPGTGIGLANVKKSVEKLGGCIWVESEPGKGSTFCIKLEPAERPA